MEKAPPTSSQWVLDWHPSRTARNQMVYFIGLISSGISGIPWRHTEVLPCWPEGHRFHRGPRGVQSRDQQLGWGANREWEVPPLSSWTNTTFNPPIWEVSITVFVLCCLSDKIKDLLKPGTVSTMTRLALVNAIYFKGNWMNRFDEANTKEMPFKVNQVTSSACKFRSYWSPPGGCMKHRSQGTAEKSA